MDASVRLVTNQLESVLQRVKYLQGMYILIETGEFEISTFHSTYAVTAKEMYDFLPTNIEEQKQLKQLGTGAMIIFRTKHLWDNILKWAVLCSLQENCIAPIMEKHCKLGTDRYNTYAECHRFDQSLINILYTNWHAFDWKKIEPQHFILMIERRTSHHYRLKYCKPNGTFRIHQVHNDMLKL